MSNIATDSDAQIHEKLLDYIAAEAAVEASVVSADQSKYYEFSELFRRRDEAAREYQKAVLGAIEAFGSTNHINIAFTMWHPTANVGVVTAVSYNGETKRGECSIVRVCFGGTPAPKHEDAVRAFYELVSKAAASRDTESLAKLSVIHSKFA